MIADAVERWRQSLADRAGCHPDVYVRAFLDTTDFVRTVERRSPDLYDEMVAIAAASNQPVDDIVVYNLMDEQWQFRRRHGVGLPGVGCSTIGTVLPDGAVMLSQNMDLPDSMDGSQAVLRILGDDRQDEQLVLTAAGMIGLFGVNRAGVACCVNALSMLPSADTGMPVAFVMREILRHRNASTAARHLMALPHASGQHYALADRSGLRGYECSAAKCAPGPVERDLLHTNHPLWWTDGVVAEQTGPADTHDRLHALKAGLANLRRPGDASALLSSRAAGLCAAPTSETTTMTFCSAEFTMSTPPAVRIALGRPDLVRWHTVRWTR